MLSDVGYRPELDQDVADGGPLPKSKAYSFDPKLGGLTARNGLGDEGWRVRGQTVELLHAVSSGVDIDDKSSETITRANRLLCSYARALLDKELPTMSLVLNNALPGVVA